MHGENNTPTPTGIDANFSEKQLWHEFSALRPTLGVFAGSGFFAADPAPPPPPPLPPPPPAAGLTTPPRAGLGAEVGTELLLPLLLRSPAPAVARVVPSPVSKGDGEGEGFPHSTPAAGAAFPFPFPLAPVVAAAAPFFFLLLLLLLLPRASVAVALFLLFFPADAAAGPCCCCCCCCWFCAEVLERFLALIGVSNTSLSSPVAPASSSSSYSTTMGITMMTRRRRKRAGIMKCRCTKRNELGFVARGLYNLYSPFKYGHTHLLPSSSGGGRRDAEALECAHP